MALQHLPARPAASAIIVGMHPGIRRDLPLLGQPDHMHRRRVAGRLAGPAFERRFQLPDRRIARPADRIERKAGAGFAAMTHDLEPAIAAIEALRDRGRWLRGAAETFHLFGPQQTFGGVGLTDRLAGLRPRTLGADPRAPDAIAKNPLSAAASHRRCQPVPAIPPRMVSGAAAPPHGFCQPAKSSAPQRRRCSLSSEPTMRQAGRGNHGCDALLKIRIDPIPDRVQIAFRFRPLMLPRGYMQQETT
jgi:hypothetical protein